MFKHHVIRRGLAAGLVLGAVALPPVAAQARYAEGSPGAAPSAPVPFAARPLPPRSTATPGFQWGDAGIGAAGAVVLLSAGAGGAAVTRRRRVQRTVLG